MGPQMTDGLFGSVPPVGSMPNCLPKVSGASGAPHAILARYPAPGVVSTCVKMPALNVPPLLQMRRLGAPQNVSTSCRKVGSPERTNSVQPLGIWRGGPPRNESMSHTGCGMIFGGLQGSEACAVRPSNSERHAIISSDGILSLHAREENGFMPSVYGHSARPAKRRRGGRFSLIRGAEVRTRCRGVRCAGGSAHQRYASSSGCPDRKCS